MMMLGAQAPMSLQHTPSRTRIFIRVRVIPKSTFASLQSFKQLIEAWLNASDRKFQPELSVTGVLNFKLLQQWTWSYFNNLWVQVASEIRTNTSKPDHRMDSCRGSNNDKFRYHPIRVGLGNIKDWDVVLEFLLPAISKPGYYYY